MVSLSGILVDYLIILNNIAQSDEEVISHDRVPERFILVVGALSNSLRELEFNSI